MYKPKLTLLATTVSVLMAVSAPALQLNFSAVLDGPSEFPPNASPAKGFAFVDYDSEAHTLHVQASFSGLLAPTTAAHIHAPTAVPFEGPAGVATTVPSFPGFPLGVTSGSFDQTYDLTDAGSFNPAYITANGGTAAGAEAALAAALIEGRAYFNIHTTEFGGGEIRGFLKVPEGGATVGLLAFGILTTFVLRRRSVSAPGARTPEFK